ncbi:MAG: hypothetical protein LR015_08240 [Verrucomicrobia bacterium]|nr:hypothetical protein [Verrucomicrobiota bacterium]
MDTCWLAQDFFAHGRLAWNPDTRVEAIADEYAHLMFGIAAKDKVASILTASYQAVSQYMCPLGLGFLHESLHHFDPDPWSNKDTAGITFDGAGRDRTRSTGSGYLALYASGQEAVFSDPLKCPPEYLLYFHHLSWAFKTSNGTALVQQLYDSCYHGVEAVCEFKNQWRSLHGAMDLERWAHVYEKFCQQMHHACKWRDLLCRFLLEMSQIPDTRQRFDLTTPIPHARIRTGFWHAVEDYHSRVARIRKRIQAITSPE